LPCIGLLSRLWHFTYKLFPCSLLPPDSLWWGVWCAHENTACSLVPWLPYKILSTYCGKAKEYFSGTWSTYSRFSPLSWLTRFLTFAPLLHATRASESTTVQVLSCGQGQRTARGEAALIVALSWARKIQLAATSRWDSRPKSKALPYQKSCIMKNQYTNRRQILDIHCQETHIQDNSITTHSEFSFE